VRTKGIPRGRGGVDIIFLKFLGGRGIKDKFKTFRRVHWKSKTDKRGSVVLLKILFI